MTPSEKFRRTIHTLSTRVVPLGLLAIASYAHADWTLVSADTPVIAIHAAGVYQAEAGQRFAPDDIVENPSGGVVQIQDESGNVVALGHETRVLLAHDAHIALLRGWIKVLHACAATAHCATPVVDTERTRFTPADHTALVIAATPPGYDNADAVFCESGSAQVLALGESREGTDRKPAQLRLDAHQFVLRARSNDTLAVSASPDPAFVANMPVTFRDALRALPQPPIASASSPDATMQPAHNLRPVTYDDVADWLHSALAVRADPATRFTERFRVRLADPAFRRDIKQHVRELPDWHSLIFPPPRKISRVPAVEPPSAYPSILVRP